MKFPVLKVFQILRHFDDTLQASRAFEHFIIEKLSPSLEIAIVNDSNSSESISNIHSKKKKQDPFDS